MGADQAQKRLNSGEAAGGGGGAGGGGKKKKGRPVITPKHRHGDTEGKPLGVGQGYRAPTFDYNGVGPKGHLVRRRETLTEPRYYTGAATEIFGSMNAEDLYGVQSALHRVGLLDDKFVTGAYNRQTGAAASQMLGSANAEGLGWRKWLGAKIDYLDENNIDSLGSSSGDGESYRALQINLTNPDEIKKDVTLASTQLLGGNYAGDPQHYVDEIHAQQTKQQTDAYNQTGGPKGSMAPQGGGGGTTYDPASVEALIMKEHPTDYAVEQTGSNAQAVLDSLLSRHAPGSFG